jgi:hypothetical protein
MAEVEHVDWILRLSVSTERYADNTVYRNCKEFFISTIKAQIALHKNTAFITSKHR